MAADKATIPDVLDGVTEIFSGRFSLTTTGTKTGQICEVHMPFITDPTWSPTRYRHALAAWQAQSPFRDSDIQPRQSEPAPKPKNSHLADKLRSLLTWRAMQRGDDWTAIPANDNHDPDEAVPPALLDSKLEQRPTIGEIRAALFDVEFGERRHAKLGGGGQPHVFAVDGDIERGRTYGQRLRDLPDCIVRLGRLHFSNGVAEEPALVLEEGKAVRGAVRIELGGLVRVGKHRPADRFRGAKGPAANDNQPTVGRNERSSSGAVGFADPLAEAQHAAWARRAVGRDTATILDLALVAANFRQIGEYLGHAGKVAERKGRAAVVDACAVLDLALAA